MRANANLESKPIRCTSAFVKPQTCVWRSYLPDYVLLRRVIRSHFFPDIRLPQLGGKVGVSGSRDPLGPPHLLMEREIVVGLAAGVNSSIYRSSRYDTRWAVNALFDDHLVTRPGSVAFSECLPRCRAGYGPWSRSRPPRVEMIRPACWRLNALGSHRLGAG